MAMTGDYTPPETLGFEYTEPSPISQFDDTDLSTSSVSKDDSSLVLSLVPPTVLLGSLLEHLCSLHEADAEKANQLFLAICHRLAKINVISPIAYLKEFTSIRSQYKAAFYNVIHSSIANLRNETFPPEVPYHLPLINSSSLPRLKHPNVFNFDVSRYNEEFEEVDCIGRGGYGYVYKAKSKIDGQLYAVKVISFSSSNLHENEVNSSRILREVQILAGLQHKNIVRYHSAWIEHKVHKSNINNTEKASSDNAFDDEESDEMELKFNSDEESTSDSDFGANGDSMSWDQNKNLTEFSKSSSRSQSMLNENNKKTNSPSKFWRGSLTSDSDSTEKVPKKKSRNKESSHLKARFVISPNSLSSKDDDNFSWDNNSRERRVYFDDTTTKSEEFVQPAASPPPGDGVILTHGVRRDREMRKVKSFFIPKPNLNDPENDIKISKDKGTRVSSNGSFGSPHKRSQSYTNMNIAASLQSKELLPVPLKSFPVIRKNPSLIMNPLKEKMVMYIQMQLCQMSLKEWLVTRNKNIINKRKGGLEAGDEADALSILKQIISALCFIHKRGLIHRDIKPRNIFIIDAENPQIMVGDFGLARRDVDTSSNAETIEPITPLISAGQPFKFHKSTSYTSGVGTATYAAPEQLNGDVYDMKADMYSLGIVVYELWWPLGTYMERANHLKLLRLPTVTIPQEFQSKYPLQAASIHRLLQHDPTLRPTAEDMMKSSFIAQSSGKIIINQRKRIWELERENETLKSTIKDLQNKLNSNKG